ncbi:MAG: hypothetical protein H0X41_10600 [Chitinophagaceae bacterium]|nr:hypothetical protein [Chitinophagaceae bacterium]
MERICMSGCFSIPGEAKISYHMKYKFISILAVLLVGNSVSAQHYSAFNGSDKFGSLSVYNNPSSIVNTPYKWDLTLFGTQFTAISNALRGKNFPFYASPKSKFSIANGNYARNADINYNIKLFNARYSINKNQAIAFGINFKGYTQASSSRINYNDSIKGALSFLSFNEHDRILHVRLAGSAWMELYGTYGFTFLNNETGKLTGGATLKIMRGMAGVFASADDVGIEKSSGGDPTVYNILNGNARYGYSSNLGDGSSFSGADLFSHSRTGFAVDLGVEYIIKTQAVTSVYDQENEKNNYEWKAGFALLDLGSNQFQFGSQSRHISSLKDNTTGSVFQDKFYSVKNFALFNDSIATIVNDAKQLSGTFNVANPARAVINVDHYISGNFYVNGELSFNLVSGKNTNNIVVKESNLITITPRWESKKFGFYAPVQFTQHGNFWIGGAIKAGPLLIGTHNLLNIFSNSQYLSGGAYLALILRPSGFIKDPHNRQYDCPQY